MASVATVTIKEYAIQTDFKEEMKIRQLQHGAQ
jgi:hypothetical protein